MLLKETVSSSICDARSIIARRPYLPFVDDFMLVLSSDILILVFYLELKKYITGQPRRQERTRDSETSPLPLFRFLILLTPAYQSGFFFLFLLTPGLPARFLPFVSSYSCLPAQQVIVQLLILFCRSLPREILRHRAVDHLVPLSSAVIEDIHRVLDRAKHLMCVIVCK